MKDKIHRTYQPEPEEIVVPDLTELQALGVRRRVQIAAVLAFLVGVAAGAIGTVVHRIPQDNHAAYEKVVLQARLARCEGAQR